ncbi:NAD(P)-binding protein [Schizophyllum commune H4-8]|uniref:Uncharacterized protein n=1 Tax=Schizophyllum commune (strain H4-8 / FGSC 9210) TaxID=578458 RepID=D8PSF3_SCHCM|nr:NAD(P)-binding protein [Schizophyllum commune H4-8]KAI5897788.1 NAD(P)-binding protein [Schizophyllum commune H4-8]
MVDLTGTVALVTGANSPGGIGFNIAQQLSNKGAKVYIGARTAEKAQAGIDTLKKANPNAEVLPFVAEIADLKQVREAAAKMLETEDRLDILVNNAAMSAPPEEQTSYGVSRTYAVKSNPVVSTSKPRSPSAPSLPTFPKACASPTNTVPVSKLANILFIKQLQMVLDAEGVPAVALAVDPGNVCTDGCIRFVGEARASQLPYKPLDGATTPLFAAAAPEVWAEREKYAGAYVVPFGQIAPGSELARDEALASKLWDLSERVVNEALAS